MSFLKKLFGWEKSEPEPAAVPDAVSTPDEPGRIEPIHVTDADFESTVMAAGRLAVVDLWADWCTPCHMLAPTIEDLAAEYGDRVIVAKLDVDHNPKSSSRFNIMGIPTVLFIKDGQEVDRIVGVQGYPAFANRVEHLLAEA